MYVCGLETSGSEALCVRLSAASVVFYGFFGFWINICLQLGSGGPSDLVGPLTGGVAPVGNFLSIVCRNVFLTVHFEDLLGS